MNYIETYNALQKQAGFNPLKYVLNPAWFRQGMQVASTPILSSGTKGALRAAAKSGGQAAAKAGKPLLNASQLAMLRTGPLFTKTLTGVGKGGEAIFSDVASKAGQAAAKAGQAVANGATQAASKGVQAVTAGVNNAAKKMTQEQMNRILKPGTAQAIRNWLYKFYNGEAAFNTLQNQRLSRYQHLLNSPQNQEWLKANRISGRKGLKKTRQALEELQARNILKGTGKLTGAQKAMTVGVPTAVGYNVFKDDPQPVYIQPPQQTLWNHLFG